MKLIIQIPCYNEADTLEIALNDLPKQLNGVDEIEYLIIDDGSNDDTIEVAKKWGVNYIINFHQNKGLAKGFMAGLDGCLMYGADIIVNTDADNQYVASDIQRLIQPILDKEADMVIGERPIDEITHFSLLKKSCSIWEVGQSEKHRIQRYRMHLVDSGHFPEKQQCD